MPNYNVDVPMMNLAEANPSRTGGDIGSQFGKIMSGVAKVGEIDKADEAKAKIDQEYNSGTGAFAGIEGSLKTRKLARLLLPLDSALSQKYLSQADVEAGREEKIKQNTEVQAARKGVSDTETYNPDMTGVDAEIKLIEAELDKRGRGFSYEGESKEPDVGPSWTTPSNITTPFDVPRSVRPSYAPEAGGRSQSAPQGFGSRYGGQEIDNLYDEALKGMVQ